MAFAEQFAQLMSERKIPLDASAVPDRDTVDSSLTAISIFMEEADVSVRDGFDEGSAEFAVCHILGDPELEIAPDIPGILEAYDRAPGLMLSQMLAISRECLDLAGN
ncbi:MAG TPA: hypothetical protein VFT47_18260 [Vicinamibacterales bacterium]|nr:hypothetical protein [Vicinamibacterales bacterium]